VDFALGLTPLGGLGEAYYAAQAGDYTAAAIAAVQELPVGKVYKIGSNIAGVVRGAGKSVGQIGREGEAAASAITGVGKNTRKFTVNGRTRIPDQVNASNISTRNPLYVTEVKNVKSQSFTRQLRDNVDLVGPGGRVDVFVRSNTKLSGPLKRANENPMNPINIRPEL